MVDFIPKIKIEIVVEADRAEQVVEKIREAANTNKIGDGKIFVIPVEEAVRVRTGATGNLYQLRTRIAKITGAFVSVRVDREGQPGR